MAPKVQNHPIDQGRVRDFSSLANCAQYLVKWLAMMGKKQPPVIVGTRVDSRVCYGCLRTNKMSSSRKIIHPSLVVLIISMPISKKTICSRGFCLLIMQRIMPSKQQTETSQSSNFELSTGSSQNHSLNKEVKIRQMLGIFLFSWQVVI